MNKLAAPVLPKTNATYSEVDTPAMFRRRCRLRLAAMLNVTATAKSRALMRVLAISPCETDRKRAR